MSIDRRALLSALSACGAFASSGIAHAQAPSAPAPSDLAARINARAIENRRKLDFDGARFSGPTWDALVEEGRASQFFLIGEEHGIAENAKMAAQLFTALAPSGYRRAVVEISPPLATELDGAARGGVEGLRRLFADRRAGVAFFGMREEAEWIVAARGAVNAREPMPWGLDYEVGADRALIDMLKAKRKPVGAEAALAALDAASAASWAQYAQTHNPQFIFSFAGDPALVRSLREAWPHADADASWIMETLEETLIINQLWVSRDGWGSNQRRALFNRANFRRHWAGERDKPRVLFKMGASHMVRGLSHTQVIDVGTLASEFAENMGAKSFHLAVFPGPGGRQAQFDPSAWRYNPVEAGTYEDEGMVPLLSAAYPDAFTLIDLRPIRPLVFGARHKALDPDLVRMIHGFDALLVMSNCTASANL